MTEELSLHDRFMCAIDEIVILQERKKAALTPTEAADIIANWAAPDDEPGVLANLVWQWIRDPNSGL